MTNAPALLQKDITDQISLKLGELQDEGLQLPAGYNPNNALKSAFFELKNVKDRNKRPALDVCSKESIANTLLNMVTQGLSPAKTQCYFIVYGDQLQMQRSYFGTQTVLKRLSGVKDIWANVIHEGDEFDVEFDEKGRERLKHHNTSFLNRDNPMIGAYAIIDTEKDGQLLTAMTKKQIDTSWTQAKTTAVHSKFSTEMAKRTVINRAAKNYINTSNDSDTLIQAINDSTENEYDEEVRRKDVTESAAPAEKTKSLAERFKERHSTEKEESVEVNYEELPENEMDIDFTDDPKEDIDTGQQEDIIDVSGYTVPQLKSALDAHEVEYDSHARKDELVSLASDYFNGGEYDGEQSELF